MRPHELNNRIAPKSSKMLITALIWRRDTFVADNSMPAGTSAARFFFMM
jgi:hypothetical protein